MYPGIDINELHKVAENWPKARNLKVTNEPVVEKQPTAQPEVRTERVAPNDTLENRKKRIRELAKKFIGTSLENEMLEYLTLGVEELEKKYEKEKTPEMENRLKEARILLEEFEKEITVIKEQMKTEEEQAKAKEEQERNLKTRIEVTHRELNNLVTTFNNNIRELTDKIAKDEDYALISVAASNVTKTFEHYLICVRNYKSYIEDYNALGNNYPEGYPELYFDEPVIEIIYKIIITKYREMDKSTELAANSAKEKLNDVLMLLPSLLKDKSMFKEIKDRVDLELQNSQNQTVPPVDEILADKEAFEAMINQKTNEYLDKMRNALSNAYGFSGIQAEYSREINQIVLQFDMLPDEIKSDIALEANKRFISTIEQEYENELLEFLFDFEQNIVFGIDRLSTIEYNPTENQEFDAEYKKLMDNITRLKNSQNATKLGIVVNFDDATQKLLVIFANDKIKDFEQCVLPKETMEKIQKLQEPQIPTPPVVDQQNNNNNNNNLDAEIEKYIELLALQNEQVNEINECNANMTALGAFDTLNPQMIDAAIEYEKTAIELNSLMIKTKLDLSDARANIRRTFNVYVNTIPQIKEYPVLKVRFEGELESFIKEHDTMAVKAELEIERLLNEKTKVSADLHAQIDEKINKLVDFKEAQNSIVGRRLVAESVEKGFDLLAKLESRREAKNKLREELRQQLTAGKKVPQPVEPTPADPTKRSPEEEKILEKQLTTELEAIFDEWLVAIDNSLSHPLTDSVNEAEFEQRIVKAVMASTATSKFAIETRERNEFEVKKTALIVKHKENSFITEINDILRKDLNSVLVEIRKNPDYIYTLENGVSKDGMAAINAIVNSEEEKYILFNKGEIIGAALNEQANKITEIVNQEQLLVRRNFEIDFENAKKAIESYEINEEFEEKVKFIFASIRAKYLELKDLDFALFMKTNTVVFSYEYKKYDLESNEYITGISTQNVYVMTESKFQKYQEYKNPQVVKPKTVQPEPEEEPTIEPEPTQNEEITAMDLKDTVQIVEVYKQRLDDTVKMSFVIEFLKNHRGYSDEKINKIIAELESRGVITQKDENVYGVLMTFAEYKAKFHNENTIISPTVATEPEADVRDIRVNNKGVLKFKTNKPQYVNRLNGKILEADAITIKLVKNGLSIKYSENLRKQLHDLNAKLNLVSKEQYRRRTSINVEDTNEPQILAFKKDFDFDPSQYELQIRAKQEGDKNSELLYHLDLDEVKEELSSGRKL